MFNSTGQRIFDKKAKANAKCFMKERVCVCVCKRTMRVTYCQQQHHEEWEEKGRNKQHPHLPTFWLLSHANIFLLLFDVSENLLAFFFSLSLLFFLCVFFTRKRIGVTYTSLQLRPQFWLLLLYTPRCAPWNHNEVLMECGRVAINLAFSTNYRAER